MQDCLFCKIAAGEIPSEKVYEDPCVYAFRDISPQAPVHVLVIPKAHIASAADITPENASEVAKCFEAIAKIASVLGLESGFRIISNCGEDASQTIKHLHFHILAGKRMAEKMV